MKVALGFAAAVFAAVLMVGCNRHCETCNPASPTAATTNTQQAACVYGYGDSISTGPKGGPLGHSITSNRPGCAWTVTVTSGGSFNRLTNGSQPNTAASLSAAIPGNTLSGVTGADSKSEYWSFVDAFNSNVDRTAQHVLTTSVGNKVKTITQTAK